MCSFCRTFWIEVNWRVAFNVIQGYELFSLIRLGKVQIWHTFVNPISTDERTMHSNLPYTVRL